MSPVVALCDIAGRSAGVCFREHTGPHLLALSSSPVDPSRSLCANWPTRHDAPAPVEEWSPPPPNLCVTCILRGSMEQRCQVATNLVVSPICECLRRAGALRCVSLACITQCPCVKAAPQG